MDQTMSRNSEQDKELEREPKFHQQLAHSEQIAEVQLQ